MMDDVDADVDVDVINPIKNLDELINKGKVLYDEIAEVKNNSEEIDVLGDIGFYPIKDQDTKCLMMVRYAGTFGQGKTKTEVDYWRFTIQWQIGTYEPENPEDGSGHPLVYQLEGETEKGPDAEAEYDEANDSWTIFFDNVNFKFEENLAELIVDFKCMACTLTPYSVGHVWKS